MREARDGRQVVITGVGVVSPVGIGADDFWIGLQKPPEARTVRHIADFDAKAHGLSHVQARRLDRFAQFAVVAAGQALADAGQIADPAAEGPLEGDDGERAGAVLGTGTLGLYSLESQVMTFHERGASRVSPLAVPMTMANAAPAGVAMRWGLRGAAETVATACASGTHAIAHAARLVAAGHLDLAVAGGTEAALTDPHMAAFAAARALSNSGVSRPFDVERDGFCASEGAGVLVLETRERAQARGARIYAEVVGAGSTCDAYHITAPAPGGEGAARSMRLALEDAGLAPREVTQINAHGTSTSLNDAAEAAAIRTVFGAAPPVTSIKGATGHGIGAAGGIEAVSVALSYLNGVIPPTVATAEVDPALGIDVVLDPRPWQPGVTLSNSFAFGGHNGTLAFAPA